MFELIGLYSDEINSEDSGHSTARMMQDDLDDVAIVQVPAALTCQVADDSVGPPDSPSFLHQGGNGFQVLLARTSRT
jgi:predicted GNAT superfamily acetyltransferase